MRVGGFVGGHLQTDTAGGGEVHAGGSHAARRQARWGYPGLEPGSQDGGGGAVGKDGRGDPGYILLVLGGLEVIKRWFQLEVVLGSRALLWKQPMPPQQRSTGQKPFFCGESPHSGGRSAA